MKHKLALFKLVLILFLLNPVFAQDLNRLSANEVTDLIFKKLHSLFLSTQEITDLKDALKQINGTYVREQIDLNLPTVNERAKFYLENYVKPNLFSTETTPNMTLSQIITTYQLEKWLAPVMKKEGAQKETVPVVKNENVSENLDPLAPGYQKPLFSEKPAPETSSHATPQVETPSQKGPSPNIYPHGFFKDYGVQQVSEETTLLTLDFSYRLFCEPEECNKHQNALRRGTLPGERGILKASYAERFDELIETFEREFTSATSVFWRYQDRFSSEKFMGGLEIHAERLYLTLTQKTNLRKIQHILRNEYDNPDMRVELNSYAHSQTVFTVFNVSDEIQMHLAALYAPFMDENLERIWVALDRLLPELSKNNREVSIELILFARRILRDKNWTGTNQAMKLILDRTLTALDEANFQNNGQTWTNYFKLQSSPEIRVFLMSLITHDRNLPSNTPVSFIFEKAQQEDISLSNETTSFLFRFVLFHPDPEIRIQAAGFLISNPTALHDAQEDRRITGYVLDGYFHLISEKNRDLYKVYSKAQFRRIMMMFSTHPNTPVTSLEFKKLTLEFFLANISKPLLLADVSFLLNMLKSEETTLSLRANDWFVANFKDASDFNQLIKNVEVESFRQLACLAFLFGKFGTPEDIPKLVNWLNREDVKSLTYPNNDIPKRIQHAIEAIRRKNP